MIKYQANYTNAASWFIFDTMKKGLFLLLSFLLISCEGGLFKDRNIEYIVSANRGEVDIIYEDEDGETVEAVLTGTSWSINFEAKKNAFLYLKAIGKSQEQILKVSIINNDEILKSNSDDGDFITVVASTNID